MEKTEEHYSKLKTQYNTINFINLRPTHDIRDTVNVYTKRHATLCKLAEDVEVVI